MSNKSTYLLPTGKSDDERLTIQSKTLEQITYDHINRAGLTKENVVADVGCGNGEVTLWLLGKVAKIYSIDISDEQLQLTKQKVELAQSSDESKSSTAVIYVKLDITNNDQILNQSDMIGKIDLIFMRLVLMHISNNLYDHTIKNLMMLLKTGGKIVSEETVWDSVFCNYHQEIVEEYKSIMLKESSKNGLDYNIGKYINTLFESAGLQVDEYSVVDRDISPSLLAKMFISLVNVLLTKHTDETSQLKYKSWIEIISTITDDTPGIIVRTSGISMTTCTKNS